MLSCADDLEVLFISHECYIRIIQILRKFEETLGEDTLFHQGFYIKPYDAFHASVEKSKNNEIFIVIRFGKAMKIIASYVHVVGVFDGNILFEKYFNGKRAFRKTCRVASNDRRLVDLKLYCLAWKLHHDYINERKRSISQSAILQSQCNLLH
jgi:hypothetical protein